MAHISHELIDVDTRLTDVTEPDRTQAGDRARKCLPHPRHPSLSGPM